MDAYILVVVWFTASGIAADPWREFPSWWACNAARDIKRNGAPDRLLFASACVSKNDLREPGR